MELSLYYLTDSTVGSGGGGVGGGISRSRQTKGVRIHLQRGEQQ